MGRGPPVGHEAPSSGRRACTQGEAVVHSGPVETYKWKHRSRGLIKRHQFETTQPRGAVQTVRDGEVPQGAALFGADLSNLF